MVLSIQYIRLQQKCIMILEKSIWLYSLKRDIVEFVCKCPNFQQPKVEHLQPGGLTQIMDFPIWKWEAINMDFVVRFPRTRKQNIQYGLLWIG